MMRYIDDLRYIVTDSHWRLACSSTNLLESTHADLQHSHTRGKSKTYLRIDEKNILTLGESGFGPLLNTKGLKLLLNPWKPLSYSAKGRGIYFKKQVIAPET